MFKGADGKAMIKLVPADNIVGGPAYAAPAQFYDLDRNDGETLPGVAQL